MKSISTMAILTLTLICACLAPAASAVIYADNSQANVDDVALTAEVGWTYLQGGAWDALDLIWISGHGQDCPLFRFNTLPGISSASVSSARLGVYVYGLYWSPSSLVTTSLQEVQGAWEENTITWDNMPTSIHDQLVWPNSDNYLDTHVISSTGWWYFDCTTLVKGWLDGATNNGMALSTADYQEGSKARMASSEYGDVSLRPVLEITVVPEPSSFAVLSVGLFPLFGLLRKRSK
jgi:hypothetical protein